MQKLIAYLVAPTLLILILMGCTHSPTNKVTETKPSSVVVDSTDYNEMEAKELADTQCAKSKRRAKKIYKSGENQSRYHYFSCIF